MWVSGPDVGRLLSWNEGFRVRMGLGIQVGGFRVGSAAMGMGVLGMRVSQIFSAVKFSSVFLG